MKTITKTIYVTESFRRNICAGKGHTGDMEIEANVPARVVKAKITFEVPERKAEFTESELIGLFREWLDNNLLAEETVKKAFDKK